MSRRKIAENISDGVTNLIKNFNKPARAVGESAYVPNVQSGNELFVQHNLRQGSLEDIARRGGLPVPSIAINKLNQPLQGFGDIRLIGDKGLISPSGNTHAYKSDAYTTRVPEVAPVESNYINELSDILKPYSSPYSNGNDVQRIIDNGIDSSGHWLDKPLLRQKLLVDQGKIKTATDFDKSLSGKSVDELIQMADAQGIDVGRFKEIQSQGKSTSRGLDVELKESIYNKQLDEAYDGLDSQAKEGFYGTIEKELVNSGADMSKKFFNGHTPSGNRKYKDDTLENLVRNMKANKGAGEESMMSGGLGSLRARLTPKFKNLNDIKSSRNRIVSPDDFKVAKDNMDSKLQKLGEDFANMQKQGNNEYPYNLHAQERFESYLADVAQGKDASDYAEFIPNANVTGFNKRVKEFADELSNMPTEYFEVKPQRAVGLDEFKGAIVDHNTTDRAIEILEQSGLRVHKLPKGQDGSGLKSEEYNKQIGGLLQEHFSDLLFNEKRRGLIDGMPVNNKQTRGQFGMGLLNE